LKGLAARLEKGPAPDLDEVGEVLAQIRGSKLLDKPSKALVVEAREAVRVGKMPDSLSLRLIAKAVTAAAAAGEEVIAQSHQALKALKERAQAVVAAPAAAEFLSAYGGLSTVAAPEPEPEPEVTIADPVASLREQSARMIASLTDREREVLATRFGVEGQPGVRNGESIRLPVTQKSLGQAFEEADSADSSDEPPTDVDIVSQAADIIEHLDMPRHAVLAGALYGLLERLDRHPLPNLDEIPLVERAERAVEREIARTIEMEGPLPPWVPIVIDWIKWQYEVGAAVRN
jgi:hypothetical protein